MKYTERIKNFYFKPQRSDSLAFLRIVFCLYIIFIFPRIWSITLLKTVYFEYEPVGIFHIFENGLGQSQIIWIEYLFPIVSWLGLLGIFTRFSMPILCLLSLVIFGYGNNFGKVDHGSQLFLMALIILSLSPSGDSLSMDSLKTKKTVPNPRWIYRWPLATIQTLTILSFFSIGAQKIVSSGFDWFLEDGLYLTLFINPQKNVLTRWILDQPKELCNILAFVVVIIIELFSPLAFFRPFKWIYPFLWLSFHIGVSLVLGGHGLFFSQVCVYFAFFNWNALFNRPEFYRSTLKTDRI